MHLNNKIKTIILVFISGLLFSCNNAQLTSLVPVSIDKALGEQAQQAIPLQFGNLNMLTQEDYPYAYKEVNGIVKDIVGSNQVKHADDFEWDIILVHDDSVLNAFCLPGGHIYIFTGIIKFLPDKAALAGVLAHEMAHADARHGTAQMLKSMGLSLFLNVVLGIDNGSLVALGSNLLNLSFSRSDETQADELSVKYLSKTRYDARGASFFFQELIKQDKNPEVISFLSTHPQSEKRVEKINEAWEKLGSPKGEKFKEEYKKLIKSLP